VSSLVLIPETPAASQLVVGADLRRRMARQTRRYNIKPHQKSGILRFALDWMVQASMFSNGN
jgi:hypothetical protein